MMFYHVYGTITNPGWDEQNESRAQARQTIRKFSTKLRDFNIKRDDGAMFILNEGTESAFEGVVVSKQPSDAKAVTQEFFDFSGITVKNISAEETTFDRFTDKLGIADRMCYIADGDDILSSLGIDGLDNRYLDLSFGEEIVESRTKKAIYDRASKLMCDGSLMPELDRIFAGRKTAFMGHPVHYMVSTDDPETRCNVCETLFEALYKRGRTSSARYIYIDADSDCAAGRGIWTKLYRCASGGAIVIRFHGDVTENEYANSIRNLVDTVGEVGRKFCNSVLTVFCFPRECTRLKNMIYEQFKGISFVEFQEDLDDCEKAKQHLAEIASSHNVEPDENLLSKISDDGSYLAGDLRRIFNDWYSDALRTKVYPQYREVETSQNKIAKEEPKGTSFEKLNRMTGLTEAKAVINRAVNFYKAQKLFSDKGFKSTAPSMHMVFTGNPGTAKTTVARLFADIMKENGILSKGGMHELGRADLVGKYVGWTAPTIKKRFEEAKGGVLFIDEAYSLVDGREGSFGDEAINTIVQEMENHRDELIVIFAGYPDKMEQFLEKNPGLRSRIAFHVPFSDYNTEELCSIAGLMAEEHGVKLTDGAKDKLHTVFDVAGTVPDFGNGRYVRNTIEQALMEHANRLVAINPDNVTGDMVTTITEEDIVIPVSAQKTISRHIGF